MLKLYTEYNDLVSNTELQYGSTLIEAYPSRSTNFWVFIVYSLVIPTQFFIYHPYGKKSLSHLAFGLLISEQSIHDSSRCSWSHQKATDTLEAKKTLQSQTDCPLSVSTQDSHYQRERLFLALPLAWLPKQPFLHLWPPHLCNSMVLNTMKTREKFTQPRQSYSQRYLKNRFP